MAVASPSSAPRRVAKTSALRADSRSMMDETESE
jgi:hypothetical protein